MKELSFLKKIKRKGIIELVESSEEMKSSYLIKAENCLKSAKILFQNQIYETSKLKGFIYLKKSIIILKIRYK